MTSIAQTHPPRRAHSRLRLRMPAKLVTQEGEKKITLLNLSQGGARVRLLGAGRISSGLLKWMDKEALGVSVWQDGPDLGLRFDNPIDWDWVVASRYWQPPIQNVRDEARSFASDWARGVNQSKFDANAPLDDQARRNKAALDIHKLRKSGPNIRLFRWALGLLVLSVLIGIGAGLWGGLF